MKKKPLLRVDKNKTSKKNSKKYEAIFKALGKYKVSMSSSEEFSKRKQEEKLLDK